MNKLMVKPEMIKWAVERSGYHREILEKKFSKLPEWECKGASLTQNQLIKLSKAVHVPYFTFFSDHLPDDIRPISDFRNLEGDKFSKLSSNLLAVIDATIFRQDWYQKFAFSQDYLPVEIIRCANIYTDPCYFATQLQRVLKFRLNDRNNISENEESFSYLINKLEELGILVMVSGIVNSNTRRKLNLEEFTGFALYDKYAPLVFVNGADSRSAQLFVLIRELGHLLLGAPGLSNVGIHSTDVSEKTEVWCNKFAGEFLVPEVELIERLNSKESLEDTINRLTKFFKVCSLIVLRRLLDINVISTDEFNYFKQFKKFKHTHTGKKCRTKYDFYSITIRRLSRKFATALIQDVKWHGTSYLDGYKLLGNASGKMFDRLAIELGITK